MNIKVFSLSIITLVLLLQYQAHALEFIIRGSVNEMYDDNINSSPDDPESDWVTNLMLGVAVRSEGHTRELELAGNIYQSYHLENKEANEFYQDATLSINKSFSENIAITISDTFQHYPEAQSFGAMFERSGAEEGYIQNDFTSGLILYATRKLFLNGVYNNSIVENESEIIADSVSHNPGGAIGYYFNSANIARAGYMYSLMKYDDNTQARGDTGYAEYERHLTRQLRGIIQGGYDYIEVEDGESFNSRWMASLIDDIDESNQLNITFLKESTISNITNDTLNNWTITCTLTHEVSMRTSLDLSAFYGDGTYEVSRVRERLGGISLSLSYAVTEFVSCNTGYTFTWGSTEDSESNELSYKRNQIYAGVSGEY